MQTPALTARQDKRTQDAALRSFHVYMYEQLRSARKDEILQHARQRIGLWKKGRLCRDYDVRFWSGVVASGGSRVFRQKVMDASERRALGRMQNTPFSFLLREFH